MAFEEVKNLENNENEDKSKEIGSDTERELAQKKLEAGMKESKRFEEIGKIESLFSDIEMASVIPGLQKPKQELKQDVVNTCNANFDGYISYAKKIFTLDLGLHATSGLRNSVEWMITSVSNEKNSPEQQKKLQQLAQLKELKDSV